MTKCRYNGKITTYNDISTTYGSKTSAYNDKLTAYNDRCTAYNIINSTYNERSTASNKKALHIMGTALHIIKQIDIRQSWRSMVPNSSKRGIVCHLISATFDLEATSRTSVLPSLWVLLT